MCVRRKIELALEMSSMRDVSCILSAVRHCRGCPDCLHYYIPLCAAAGYFFHFATSIWDGSCLSSSKMFVTKQELHGSKSAVVVERISSSSLLLLLYIILTTNSTTYIWIFLFNTLHYLIFLYHFIIFYYFIIYILFYFIMFVIY